MKQLGLLVLSLFIVFSCSKSTDNFPGELGLWVLDEITAEGGLTPAMEDDLYEYRNLSWVEFLDENHTTEGYKKLKINAGIDFRNQNYNPTADLTIRTNLGYKKSTNKIEIRDFTLEQAYILNIEGKDLRITKNNGYILSYYWLRKK